MLPLLIGIGAVYVLTTMKPTGRLKSTAPVKRQVNPVQPAKNANVMTQTANQPWAQPVAQARQTLGGVGAIASTSASVIHSLADVWGTVSSFGGSKTDDWDSDDYDEDQAFMPDPSEDQSHAVEEYVDDNSDYQDYEYADSYYA